MTHNRKCRLTGLLLLLMVLILAFPMGASAAEPKLNSTKVSMVKGKTYTLKLKNASGKITWSSNKKSVATVSSAGKITAKGAGTAVIKAKYKGLYYYCTVTVKQPVTAVKMKYKNIKISEGRTFALESTVLPASASNKSLTWSSSNTKIVKVDSNGVITTIAPGTAVVTAKAKDGSGKKAISNITVKKAPIPKHVQFLRILERMSQKAQSDYAAGTPWTYSNSGAANYYDKALRNNNLKCNCALLVRFAMREMGILDAANFYGVVGGGIHYSGTAEKQLKAHCEIYKAYKTPAQLLSEGKLQPGDICTWADFQHTNVYAGDNLWYDAGRFAGANGSYVNGVYTFTTFGPVASTGMNSIRVGYVIRIVK